MPAVADSTSETHVMFMSMTNQHVHRWHVVIILTYVSELSEPLKVLRADCGAAVWAVAMSYLPSMGKQCFETCKALSWDRNPSCECNVKTLQMQDGTVQLH